MIVEQKINSVLKWLGFYCGYGFNLRLHPTSGCLTLAYRKMNASGKPWHIVSWTPSDMNDFNGKWQLCVFKDEDDFMKYVPKIAYIRGINGAFKNPFYDCKDIVKKLLELEMKHGDSKW